MLFSWALKNRAVLHLTAVRFGDAPNRPFPIKTNNNIEKSGNKNHINHRHLLLFLTLRGASWRKLWAKTCASMLRLRSRASERSKSKTGNASSLLRARLEMARNRLGCKRRPDLFESLGSGTKGLPCSLLRAWTWALMGLEEGPLQGSRHHPHWIVNCFQTTC